MCRSKDKPGGPPGGPPPTDWLGRPLQPSFPERRPIRRGGGLWGGEGDETRFTPLTLLRSLLAMCKSEPKSRTGDWFTDIMGDHAGDARRRRRIDENHRQREEKRRRDFGLGFIPLLALTTLAMCGEKRYFGDDRTDDHIVFKRDLDERKRKRDNKKDGGGAFPWSFRRLADRLLRRLPRPA